MSTKKQNLKRKKEGMFTNIEKLEKKKIILDSSQAKSTASAPKQPEKKKKPAEHEDQQQQQQKKKKKGGQLQLSSLAQKNSDLWSKSVKAEDKVKLIGDILGQVQNILDKYTLKKDGSKIIQGCMKHGSQAQREQIYKAILESPQIEEIIQSKYGHYAILRMIKYMLKEFKQPLFDVLIKKAYYYMTHVQAGQVLDKFVRELATPNQLNQLKQVFQKSLESKDMAKQENIENMAMKLIDKQNHYSILSKHVLTLAMPILVPTERQKLIDYLCDKVLELLDDKEGIKLCISLINYASAKDRKNIVKCLKGHLMDIIKTENSQSFIVIQKLLHSLDDTVLLDKQVLSELKKDFPAVFNSKSGFNIVSSIFMEKHNLLKTFENEVKFTTR